jgi:hypothetical protein
VIRKRNIPALISTVALIAGCGSTTRSEVSGVVRDARTGRAIPFARIVSLDGSATHADAHGRFTISVSRGLGREIRASAEGRCDASTRVDVRLEESTPIELELAPCEHERERAASAESEVPDAEAVLRWIDDLDLAPFAEGGVLAPAPEASAPTAELGPTEAWALGGMELAGADVAGGGEACARCHDGAVFAAAHGGASASGSVTPTIGTEAGACASCHDGSTDDRYGLRIYEHAEEVAGARANGLGTGAICVSCHRSVDGAIAHAPQADVLLGRGARSAVDPGEGVHAWIADSCVGCHAGSARTGDVETLALGHTFRATTTEARIAREACSACHGEVEPESIGIGDRDGDGIAGTLGDEHDRAVARARDRLGARITAARVGSTCNGHVARAAGFVEHEGSIWLTDVRGALLGDCDLDRSLDRTERGVGLDVLDVELRDAVIDLAMIERDGSRGVHHPRFAFAVLDAVSH